jgi:hypothetical protein
MIVMVEASFFVSKPLSAKKTSFITRDMAHNRQGYYCKSFAQALRSCAARLSGWRLTCIKSALVSHLCQHRNCQPHQAHQICMFSQRKRTYCDAVEAIRQI